MTPVIKSVELPNQVRLPYVEQGNPSGVPTLLLHGYTDSWRSFELVLGHLSDSIHAFAPTLRGHGDASRPSSGYHPQNFAEDLIAFMDALHLERAVIVGGSSGGFVARHIAIDHSDRILGLVFIGAPGILGDKPGARELWESSISKLKDPIDPNFVREFQESTMALSVPEAFLQMIVQESLKVPARVWRDTFQGLLEDDSFQMLDQIRAPTHIIWGDQDSFLPQDDQIAFAAAISDSRLVVYPGAGHALQWEKPDSISAELVAFIEHIAVK